MGSCRRIVSDTEVGFGGFGRHAGWWSKGLDRRYQWELASVAHYGLVEGDSEYGLWISVPFFLNLDYVADEFGISGYEDLLAELEILPATGEDGVAWLGFPDVQAPD